MPLPAKGCATRTQHELFWSFAPSRSQWNCSLMRPMRVDLDLVAAGAHDGRRLRPRHARAAACGAAGRNTPSVMSMATISATKPSRWQLQAAQVLDRLVVGVLGMEVSGRRPGSARSRAARLLRSSRKVAPQAMSSALVRAGPGALQRLFFLQPQPGQRRHRAGRRLRLRLLLVLHRAGRELRTARCSPRRAVAAGADQFLLALDRGGAGQVVVVAQRHLLGAHFLLAAPVGDGRLRASGGGPTSAALVSGLARCLAIESVSTIVWAPSSCSKK